MNNDRGKLVQAPDLGRRRVLGTAVGLGTAAGLGLLSVPAHASGKQEPAKEAGPRTYEETEHVRRYYRSARL